MNVFSLCYSLAVIHSRCLLPHVSEARPVRYLHVAFLRIQALGFGEKVKFSFGELGSYIPLLQVAAEKSYPCGLILSSSESSLAVLHFS